MTVFKRLHGKDSKRKKMATTLSKNVILNRLTDFLACQAEKKGFFVALYDWR